ncbi:MAG: hypothetical protein AB7F64_09145, partial [Gammaproteobacteria bacterium]
MINPITNIVVPSVIILISNIFSGKHGSYRYEVVSAILGWIGGGGLLVGFITYYFSFLSLGFWLNYLSNFLLSIGGFSA